MSNRVESLPPEGKDFEITVALVRKTQGRKGEVASEILTDFPERFERGRRVRLVKDDGTESWRIIEKSWFHKRFVILKFSGIESIGEAEVWVGAEVKIPRSEAIPLSINRHYIFELVGCRVVSDHDGHLLGCVEDFMENAGNPLLSVKTKEGELWVPFVEEICRSIDTQQREIRVRLPEGLLDLNHR